MSAQGKLYLVPVALGGEDALAVLSNAVLRRTARDQTFHR